MGSTIPQLLEGTPFHDDDFVLTFAIASGSVAVGNVVVLGGAWAIQTSTSSTAFPIGICLTSGQLSSAISVAVRGVLDVVVDNTTTAGDYLIVSSTAGQMHDNGSTAPAYGGRAIALSSGSATGTVQALFV